MHSTNKCIIPECYIDSCLIEVLINADNDFVNHQKSNGKVANEMKNKFANRFCIGIIDEDRQKLDYLNAFDEVKVNDFLKLWQHKDKNNPHFMIQIRPVVEKWILNICDLNKIELSDFNLPKDLKDFLRISKSVSSRKDDRFIKLFKAMKNKKCLPLIELKNWIEFLRDNKENINLELF